MKELEFLLKQIGAIVQRDAQHRKEREERGEFFNVFEVLNLDTNETRTHSAFLAALLDPNGRHGAGDKFLKAFINSVDCLKDFDIDTKDAKVEIEYPIGNKNENITEGGRIDILIKSHGKSIIIENKIYAGDQENQLLRYHNFAKLTEHRLLYLTLNGCEASEYSTDNKLVCAHDYYAIGYNKEIINWIDDCIAEAARLPIVRETLIQYQNLIKNLTCQNMETEYGKQVLDAMVENIDTVAAIVNQLDNWRTQIIKKLIEDLEQYATSKGLKFKQTILLEDGSLNQGIYDSILSFYKDSDKEKWEKSAISIQNHGRGLNQFYFGINKDLEASVEHKAVFSTKTNEYWPYGQTNLGKYSNWTYDIMPDINNGEVAKYIKDLVELALKKIEELNLRMP